MLSFAYLEASYKGFCTLVSKPKLGAQDKTGAPCIGKIRDGYMSLECCHVCSFMLQELEAIKARVMELEEEEEEKLREAQYCSDKPFPYGPLQTGELGQLNPSALSSLPKPWQYCAPKLGLVKECADCIYLFIYSFIKLIFIMVVQLDKFTGIQHAKCSDFCKHVQ